MRENGSHCDLKFMWLTSRTADENWSADYHLLCCSSPCKYSTVPPTAWDLSPHQYLSGNNLVLKSITNQHMCPWSLMSYLGSKTHV